jgi:hypothetical protein
MTETAAGPGTGDTDSAPDLSTSPPDDVTVSSAVKQADVLDDFSEKLAAFNALRKNDKESADKILDLLGSTGPVEQAIIRELALPKPIYLPDRFDEAHRLVMKSLEVLRRNGARAVTLREGKGPLRSVAAMFINFVVKMMVMNYLGRASRQLFELYNRRSTWVPAGAPENIQLRRARMQVQRVLPSYQSEKFSFPKFLVGGAVLSSLLGALQSAAISVRENPLLVIVTTAALLLLLLGGAWCVVRAAAIARKRIRLTADKPFEALYQVMGAAGEPPSDDTFQFALFALIGMALAWILVPIGLFFVFN